MLTVYLHTNRVNGKRYVGITKSTAGARWKQHVSDAKTRPNKLYFTNAVRKYGPSAFDHEVLETVATRAAANEAETWWIAHFCSDDARFGYNLDAGGRSKNTSPATKAKQSASQRRRFSDPVERAKLSAAHTGMTSSDTHCRAISDALKEHYKDPERRSTMGHRGANTPEVNAKRAATLREVYKNNPELLARVSAKGRRHTDETKQKMREAALIREAKRRADRAKQP